MCIIRQSHNTQYVHARLVKNTQDDDSWTEEKNYVCLIPDFSYIF